MFLSPSLSLSQNSVEPLSEENVCKTPAARWSLFSSQPLAIIGKEKIEGRKGRKQEGRKTEGREGGFSRDEVDHVLLGGVTKEDHRKDIPSR